MQEPKVPISVLFLIENDYAEPPHTPDTVFAFWNESYTDGQPYLSSYSHVGQHSPCHKDYVNECKHATKEQYQDLLKEMEGLGYEITVLNEEQDNHIDDNGNCIYCGERCFDGEGCDEQNAGGF